jgi:triphosphoribosyl-dephospho-CoA synthase
VIDLSVRIAAAFQSACRDELEAPKPGNVHIFATGGELTPDAFIRSAEVSVPSLSKRSARVGARILGAIEATHAAVGTNTNLGIVLLCAPLAVAAELAAEARTTDFHESLRQVLDDLDIEDAELAFRAIALANPAGLGRTDRYDVRAPATGTLMDAMQAAADRDRIAQQYASGFADVFDVGLPVLKAALLTHSEPKWATLAVYLNFLAAFPDSHIARKYGIAAAEELRQNAREFRQRLRVAADPAHLLADLLTWDASLKARRLNPGTSADLTVATLFAHRLRTILPTAGNSD